MRAEAGQAPEPRAASGLVYVLLPLWLLAAVIGSLAGSQALVYHWTQAAVPLSVLASLGLVRCLEACGSRPWRRYLAGVVVVTLALTLILPLRGTAWRWRDRVFKPPEAGRDYQAGKHLAEMTTPEDYILVLDHVPSPVFWSGRRVASRYMMLEHLWNPALYAARSPRLKRWLGPLADPRALFLQDVRRHPPRYILVPREQEWWENELAVPEQGRVIDILLADYELVGHSEAYEEYRRKSAGN